MVMKSVWVKEIAATYRTRRRAAQKDALRRSLNKPNHTEAETRLFVRGKAL